MEEEELAQKIEDYNGGFRETDVPQIFSPLTNWYP